MQYNILWKICLVICTDKVTPMDRPIKGFITLAKQININIIHTHFFLHYETHILKILSLVGKLNFINSINNNIQVQD
jgi:hypothetical protein